VRDRVGRVVGVERTLGRFSPGGDARGGNPQNPDPSSISCSGVKRKITEEEWKWGRIRREDQAGGRGSRALQGEGVHKTMGGRESEVLPPKLGLRLPFDWVPLLRAQASLAYCGSRRRARKLLGG